MPNSTCKVPDGILSSIRKIFVKEFVKLLLRVWRIANHIDIGGKTQQRIWWFRSRWSFGCLEAPACRKEKCRTKNRSFSRLSWEKKIISELFITNKGPVNFSKEMHNQRIKLALETRDCPTKSMEEADALEVSPTARESEHAIVNRVPYLPQQYPDTVE